jgi:hypothetical protein
LLFVFNDELPDLPVGFDHDEIDALLGFGASEGDRGSDGFKEFGGQGGIHRSALISPLMSLGNSVSRGFSRVRI